MAVSMIGPKFYAWDKNGKPLAFGKLYTYQARTNTPKPTYQSEDQVVENTNPVILNGEGYANVYLSGSYKMVLKDKDDNEIWSSDPVSAAQPEEWVNCLTATYLSPTTFKVGGNFTEQYGAGRRVRLDNNTSEYSYSTIVDSVYASSETTVTILSPVVTTGIVESCVSIIGPDSIWLNRVESIDALRQLSPDPGQIIELIDYYGGYNAQMRPPEGGGKFYIDQDDVSSVDDGGMIIVCANDARAKRIYEDKVLVEWFGASTYFDDANANKNVTAFTNTAKFCFEGKTQENSVPAMWFSISNPGGYKVDSTTPIPYNTIRMGSDGEARIQPLNSVEKFTCFDNETAVTERCKIHGLIFQMFGDFDAINLSFGSNSAFRFSRLSRNAEIDIYCIGGDTGLDLASSQDHWGINLGPMCRFELQKFPLRLDVNGQTFTVNGGLFNSTVKAGVDVTVIGNSSQVSFKGTVFENDGVNTSGAGGKMLRLSGNIKEVIFDSCQSERLGYYADRLGAISDYDVVIQGVERVTLINSRMWGGGYGSVAPGNSRNFGWWLENCSLKLISSRLWSFSEKAIHCVGDVSISCDSKSQVDGRIDGDFKIVSNADLGKNQISSPDGSRYELSRGQPVPLGWRHLEATASPQSALVTTGLSEQSSKHGFTFTDSTVYTNPIKVTQGDEICLRFFGEFAGTNCELFAYKFNPDGTIDLNNSNDPDTTLIKSFTMNSTGAEGGRAYFILKHVIDQDVELVGFRFNRKFSGDLTNYIEAPAIYLNSGIDWKDDSAYSDNDSSFGFRFYLGPLLPALPNADLTSAKTDLKGLYRQGEIIGHQWTASTEPLISTFDNTGDIDGSAINLVTVATKP